MKEEDICVEEFLEKDEKRVKEEDIWWRRKIYGGGGRYMNGGRGEEWGGEICMEKDGMSGDYEDTVCVTED